MSNEIKPKEERNTNIADECIIYWDFDSISISNGDQLRVIMNGLTQKIRAKIGAKPIQFRIYSCVTKLPRNNINGIQHIVTSSTIIDSVNKRILIDISYKLYELQKYNKSNCIALISNDDTFAHLLSKIRSEPPISNTLLISLNPHQQTNPNLTNHVDCVITHSIDSNTMENNIRKRLSREYGKNENDLIPIPKKQKMDNTPVNITFEHIKTKTSITMQLKPRTNFGTVSSLLLKQVRLNKTLKPLNKQLGQGQLQCKLYFNGTLLPRSQCVHNIPNPATIQFDCVWEDIENGILINVEEFGENNCIQMTVDLTWKTKLFRKILMQNSELKVCLKNKYGITPSRRGKLQLSDFKLLFNGFSLKNNKTLSSRGICEGNTLIWYLDNIHLIKITVKALDISYCKEFNFKLSDHENQFKKKIRKDIISEIRNVNDLFDVEENDISFWWKGCQLTRQLHLISYGVSNGDVIVCCLNNANKMRAKDMSMQKYDVFGDNTNNSIKKYENEIIDKEMFQKNMKRKVDDVDIKNVKMPDLENGSDCE